MEKLKFRGGATIGMSNMTWPFVSISITKNRIELNASIMGNLVFQPKDIISIEPYSQTFLGKGIKINHTIESYPEMVVFWSRKDPNTIVNQIENLGFFKNVESNNFEVEELIIERQKSGSFPIKNYVAIGIIVLWNILFFSDFIKFYSSGHEGRPSLGNGSTLAIIMILAFSLLTLLSNRFRNLVLKKGRTLRDINKFIYLMIFICVLMLFFIFFVQ